MDPRIWGPPLWEFLHILSISYPDKPTKFYIDKHRDFLLNLGYILPCPICGEHYFDYMSHEKIEMALKSKSNYMKLIFDLHNNVNEINKKNIMKWNNFLDKYQNIITGSSSIKIETIDKKNTSNNSLIIFLLIIILILIIVLVFIVRYKLIPNRENMPINTL